MKVRITTKWRKMSEIYKLFADASYDFSEEAAQAMFQFESYGGQEPEKNEEGLWNGYWVGKKWMDLTITEYWIPDLENRELFKAWLYADPKLPRWFLDKVLPERFRISDEDYEWIKKNLPNGY